jgi:iron(III) transport system substrate-binding protein
MHSMRLLVSVLALVLFASACGGNTADRGLEGAAAEIFSGTCAAGKGQEVTIYSGRTENLIEPVLNAFSCETGIDVAVRWGDSTQLALLLDEEGDRTPADIFLSRSPGPVGFLEARGLLGTIDDSVLGLVAEENSSATGSWVGFSGRKRVAVYNLDAVTEQELPESIFDLTKEPWRGRVALPATNGSFVDWFTVFRDQFGTDVATQWLDEMVANDAKYYPNNRSIVEAAGRGEVDLGLVNHYYNYQEVAAAGDDHRALNHDLGDADIGSLLIITAATITQASENANEANQLLGYLLSEPVQRYFTEETFEYPLAAGVPAAEALPALTALEVGSVDFDALGGGFEETTRIIEASGIANQ